MRDMYDNPKRRRELDDTIAKLNRQAREDRRQTALAGATVLFIFALFVLAGYWRLG